MTWDSNISVPNHPGRVLSSFNYLTISELSKILDVNEEYTGLLLNGERHLSKKMLMNLSYYFNASQISKIHEARLKYDRAMWGIDGSYLVISLMEELELNIVEVIKALNSLIEGISFSDIDCYHPDDFVVIFEDDSSLHISFKENESYLCEDGFKSSPRNILISKEDYQNVLGFCEALIYNNGKT